VIAGVGLVSRSRFNTLGPVFVTPAPASTDAAAAVPRLMVVGVAAPALSVITPARSTVGIPRRNTPSMDVFFERIGDMAPQLNGLDSLVTPPPQLGAPPMMSFDLGRAGP